MNENVNEKKKGGLIIFICCVVILALVGVIVVLLLKDGTLSNKQNNGRNVIDTPKSVVISEDNADDIESLLPHTESRPVSFTEKMNHTWTFLSGDAVSEDAYVTNHNDNEYSFYFDVKRLDTKECIYSSPIIPVGVTLKDIKLDTKLPKGKYECFLECHMVESDNVTEYSTINLILTINVEN